MKSRLQFPESWFEDEVRDGFYISGMMKRSWAAQLEVFADVADLCERHGIQYFADAGTLLGAVRHGGYIPWDDDFDICMKRADHDRFVEIVQKELAGRYYVHNVHTNPGYDMAMTRIVNGNAMCFQPDFLEKYHDFPFIAGIDICPMDDIIPDAEMEKSRCEVARYIATLAKELENCSGEMLEYHLGQIEKACGKKINRRGDVRNQLYLLMEQMLTMYNGLDAEELAVMAVWLKYGTNKFKKEWYQDTILLPLETTEIRVPAMYDAILKEKYGDYMKIVKGGGLHDYPFYKGQEKLLLERTGVNLEPRFQISAEELERICLRNEKYREKHGTGWGDAQSQSRINLKLQAREIIAVIREAHEAIWNAVRLNSSATAMSLLEICQNGAINIGTAIEQVMGEGFVTVKLLEEYCEKVYGLHEALAVEIPTTGDILPENGLSENNLLGNDDERRGIDAGISGKISELYISLCQQLENISDSVEHDIQYRREIVFLPYKASHWDALDSVWRSAVEDPNCDVYVVPIPYCYKRIDGSFREFCYDGEKFPADIPITWYGDYDLAKRRPDTIIIQNPYDEYHHTVSVHPEFYSGKLRQYTDQLVYIPYFVLDEIDTADERSMQSLQYFVTVPGVVRADQVIVQSEKMRETYIDCLSRFVGEDTRKIWEEKILGIGSSLYDKKAENEKEKMDIPEEWKSVLMGIEMQSDENRKSVILYHTSASMLLQEKERMLDKIQVVLAFFEKKQDEVALIWRPEALMQEKVSRLNPYLWGQYKKIVDEYREAGWGIYDDGENLRDDSGIKDEKDIGNVKNAKDAKNTENAGNTRDIMIRSGQKNMDRIIRLCDGYYGDSGVLAQMFQKHGKAVMIQDVTMMDYGEHAIRLISEDCVKVGDELFLFSRDVNLLYAVSLKNGEVRLVSSIPEEDFCTPRLCTKLVHWKNELVVVPANAKKIWVYHLETGEWRGILLWADGNENLDLKFFQAIPYGDDMFLIGGNHPAIVRLNMKTETLTYHEDVFEHLHEKKEELNDRYMRPAYVQMGSCFYMASVLTNQVLKFDMENGEFVWIQVGSDNNRYSGIAWDGTYFWLSPRKNTPVVRWDGKDEVTEYPLPRGFEANRCYFLKILYDGKAMILPSSSAKNMLKILNCQENPLFETIPGQYWLYQMVDDELFVKQTCDGNLWIIDKGDDEDIVGVSDTNSTDGKKDINDINGVNNTNSVAHSVKNCPCSVDIETWNRYLHTQGIAVFKNQKKQTHKENLTMHLQSLCV